MDIQLFKNTFVVLRGLILLAAICLVSAAGAADTKPAKSGKDTDKFMPFVELAPFVVNGKQLAISIHARSKGDRRYAEGFSEEVVRVVYEGVTQETGKGLVIIGKKGEPHPVFVFRKFLKLAEEGKLDPAVAARGPELFSMLDHWENAINTEKHDDAGAEQDVDMEFEQILTALPLPLEGIGAKLYQLAWAENFDDKKVEAKFKALHVADLEGNMFARFDWVFYLPPRGAFEQAIDDIVAGALKEEKVGFFTRAMIKGAMMMVKPFIRKAIEAMRRGVLFSTVVQARADLNPEEVSELTSAYVDVMMPDHEDKKSAKDTTGSEHDRAVRAVRAKFREIGAKPKPVEELKPAEEPKSVEESQPAEEPVPEPTAESK